MLPIDRHLLPCSNRVLYSTTNVRRLVSGFYCAGIVECSIIIGVHSSMRHVFSCSLFVLLSTCSLGYRLYCALCSIMEC